MSNQKLSIDLMKKIAQERGGQCLSETYINSHKHLEWECSKKHTWRTCYSAVRSGCWCPQCSYGDAGKQRRKSLKEIREFALTRGFTLLSSAYIRNNQHLEWKCKSGHTWKASYNSVQSGNGCPHCWGSLPEEKSRFILEQLFQSPFPKLGKIGKTRLQLDGYNARLNLAFEYNGQQHYEYTPVFHRTLKGFEEQKKRDKKKLKLCEEEGIELIVIPCTKKKST